MEARLACLADLNGIDVGDCYNKSWSVPYFSCLFNAQVWHWRYGLNLHRTHPLLLQGGGELLAAHEP